MISRIKQRVLALTFLSVAGFAFTPLGCGSSTPPAVSVPSDADLVRQLQRCSARHEDHLGSAQHSISFDVHVGDDGEVESVALRDATLRDQDLETCMASALRTLRVEDLPMRLSGSRYREPVTLESRAFLGQAEIPLELTLEACLASPPCALALGLVVGASFIALTVYVYVNTKPSLVRPRPPATLATSMPTATAAPTAIPVPVDDVAEAARRRPKPNMNRCLDAAAGGPYLWEYFCNSFTNKLDKQGCWSKWGESEQNKRNWCRNRFGN